MEAQPSVHEPNLRADPKAILLHRFLSSYTLRSPSAAALVLPSPCCCHRVKLRPHPHPAFLVARTSKPPLRAPYVHAFARQPGPCRIPQPHACAHSCSPVGAVIICGPRCSAVPLQVQELLGTATQHCISACNGRIDCVTAEAAASCDPVRTTYTLSTRTRPATWISSGLPTPKRRMPAARRGMLHMERPPRNLPNGTPARPRNTSRTHTHRPSRPRAPAPLRCSRLASPPAAARTSTTTTAT